MRAAITLHDEMAELPRIVAFTTEFAKRNGLPAHELSRTLVILDELFSNIVRHGYEDINSGSGRIELSLSLSDNYLRIELTDDGRAFDPLGIEGPDLDKLAVERPIGGLGIHIVRNLVDQAQYTRQGERNRLVLNRRIAPGPAD
jgi:anti-sigma regulatory factor (Ser/Thr protein kinase)